MIGGGPRVVMTGENFINKWLNTLIDTGAAINLITKSSLTDLSDLNVQDNINIVGLSNNRIKSLGTIKIPMNNETAIRFHVIPIKHPRQANANISFDTETITFEFNPLCPLHFCMGKCQIKYYGNNHVRLTGGGPRINVKTKDLLGGQQPLLIDTGSDINLIERISLAPHVLIAQPKVPFLLRVTADPVPTSGLLHLNILGTSVPFHIVEHKLPVNGVGVLGLEFLVEEKVDIKYLHHTIVTKRNPNTSIFWHKDRQKDKPITIPPRVRMAIQVPTQPGYRLSTGYLPKVKTPKGVHLGECVLQIDNGIAYAMIINTRKVPVDVDLSPQRIEPYDIQFDIEDESKEAACCLGMETSENYSARDRA